MHTISNNNDVMVRKLGLPFRAGGPFADAGSTVGGRAVCITRKKRMIGRKCDK
jgi:hypothetical protein